MYALVELNGTVSLIHRGQVMVFGDEVEVRDAIQSLTNVLFELKAFERMEVEYGGSVCSNSDLPSERRKEAP